MDVCFCVRVGVYIYLLYVHCSMKSTNYYLKSRSRRIECKGLLRIVIYHSSCLLLQHSHEDFSPLALIFDSPLFTFPAHHHLKTTFGSEEEVNDSAEEEERFADPTRTQAHHLRMSGRRFVQEKVAE